MKYGILIYQDETDLFKFISEEKNRKYDNMNLLGKIEELCSKLRNLELNGSQINRDGLLGSLRKLKLIYEELLKCNKDNDKREIFLVSFFHYYKVILEIIKNNFNYINLNKNLFIEITDIRNFFAHSYEKKFFQGKKVFVRLSPCINNPELTYLDKKGIKKAFSGIDSLEIFNLEDSEKIAELFFSINFFYFELIKYVVLIINKI